MDKSLHEIKAMDGEAALTYLWEEINWLQNRMNEMEKEGFQLREGLRRLSERLRHGKAGFVYDEEEEIN